MDGCAGEGDGTAGGGTDKARFSRCKWTMELLRQARQKRRRAFFGLSLFRGFVLRMTLISLEPSRRYVPHLGHEFGNEHGGDKSLARET